MTTTPILNAVSFGTSTNTGNYFTCTKTSLQAATSAVKIAVTVSLGANSTNRTTRVRVWQATSPTSYASGLRGCVAVSQGAIYTEVNLVAQDGELQVENSSDIIVCAAGYHYCWVEAPTLDTAATITVNLMELP